AFAQRLRVEGGDAADAAIRRSDGDADLIVPHRGLGPRDAGVLERQLRRAREQQGRPVVVPDALGPDERRRRELGDLAGHPAPAPPGVEEGERTETRGPSGEAAPERLPSCAEGGDDSQTGHDDPLHDHPANLRRTTQLLLPPKAIALLSATRSDRLRATFGT